MKYKLTRAPVHEEMINNQHVWPLIVDFVSFMDGFPDDIFVYQHFIGGLLPDTFQCVASLPQLSELGTEPLVLDDVQIPFYVKSRLRLDCRSLTECDESWEIIRLDVDALVRNFELAGDLEQQQIVEGS